jgi:DME family drug/metabolite transporter
LAAVLWGTTGTAQALAPPGANPEVVGAVRIAIGGAALLVIAAARGELKAGRRWPPTATLASAIGVAAYQALFFAGVARTGVAVGTIVAIGSAPVFGGLLGFLVRGERPGRSWALATLLAILGSAVLVGSGGRLAVDAPGLAFAVGAGASYATYTTAGKRIMDHQPPGAAMAVAFGLGAVLLAPLLVTGDLSWLASPRGIAVALHLGLVATALAYLLFGRGLSLLPVGAAATLSLAEPLTAGALGVVLLGERLTFSASIGACLVLCGMVVLVTSLGTRRHGSG